MFEVRLRDEAKETLRDYETFVKIYAQLNREIDDASAKLKKFYPKGAMGIAPDKVKSDPKYKKARAEYEKASKTKELFDAFIRVYKYDGLMDIKFSDFTF
jgi:hypothetical protein